MMKKNENKKASGSRQRILIALIVLLLLGGLIALYATGVINQWLGKPSNSTLSEKGIRVELNADGAATVRGLGGLVIRANKSGVRAADASGKTVWDIACSMIAPYIESAGDYIAVADRKGTEAILISSDGNAVRLSADAPILLHSVSEGGRVVLITAEDKTNTLLLFESDGRLLLKRKTYQNKDGIPAAAAVSADGSRLVCSLLSYAGGSVASIVTFFDLSDKGADLADRILSSRRMDNELVTDLAFRGDVCLYASDLSFGAFDRAKGSLLWGIVPEQKMSVLAFGAESIAVGLGDPAIGVAEEAKENFILYSMSGNVIWKMNVKGLRSLEYNAGIYVAGGQHYDTALAESGKKLWDFDSVRDYARLIPLGDRKTVVAQSADSLIYYRVVEQQEEIKND